jgi:glyoxylase I family protein
MSQDSQARFVVSPVGIHHVRLTVTDIGRSKQFYSQVFGVDPAVDFSDHVAEPGVQDDPEQLFGGCVFPIGDQLLGLRPAATTPDSFDSTRVGLDHISLTVGSVQDLHGAVARLDSAGIAHGEIKELKEQGMAILSLQDPDDINLELTALTSTGQ